MTNAKSTKIQRNTTHKTPIFLFLLEFLYSYSPECSIFLQNSFSSGIHSPFFSQRWLRFTLLWKSKGRKGTKGIGGGCSGSGGDVGGRRIRSGRRVGHGVDDGSPDSASYTGLFYILEKEGV